MDYVDRSVPLTFSADVSQVCFNVSIIDDDNYELVEEFYANLTTADPNVQLSPMFTVLRINDDDSKWNHNAVVVRSSNVM